MSRLPLLDPASFTPEQSVVYDAIRSGPRGQVRGPFLALLHAPDLAGAVQALGSRLRFSGKIPPVLREIAILTVANYWNSAYEWAVHEHDALKAGVQPDMVDAIRRGAPMGASTPEEMIHDFTLELLSTGRVGQTLYEKALGAWQPASLVEVNVVVGYYTMLALLLNANSIEPPK